MRSFLQCSFVLGLFFFSPILHAQTTSKSAQLTLLYTTDLEGRLRDFRCKRTGVKDATVTEASRDVSNLLHKINEIRNEIVRLQRPFPLLLNTGSNLAPSTTARFLLEFEGLSGVDFIAQIFKSFGYDLIGLGLQDFSVPKDKLRDFLQQARLKGLSFSAANLTADDNHPIARYVNRSGINKVTSFIFQRGGFKIGVFHVLPNEFQNRLASDMADGLKFEDPGTKASEIATKLREQGADLVIALAHLEDNTTKGAKSKEFLSSASGVDIVISNEMRESDKPTITGTFDSEGKGVYIVSGSRFGDQLGRLEITLSKEKDQPTKITSFQVSTLPLNDDKYDKEMRRDLKKWESSYCRRWGQPLGTGIIRTTDGMTKEQFTAYVLNIVREKTGAEVAFIPKFMIQGEHFPLKGYITKDDIYKAMSFNDSFQRFRLKGSEITALEQHGSQDGEKGLYLSGITSGKINSRPVDEALYYRVVTVSFVTSRTKDGWFSTLPKGITPVVYDDKTPPRLRDLAIYHFATNEFDQTAKPPPPKPPAPTDPKAPKPPPAKPFEKGEIPYPGDFYKPDDRLALKFNTQIDLGFTAIFVNPINIGTFYTQSTNFNNTFYEKYNGTLTADFKLQADTRMHFLLFQLTINYEADANTQWGTSPSGGPGPTATIFQESNDKLTFRSEYRFRYFEATFPGETKWYYTSPFLEYQLVTELTRGPQAQLSGFLPPYRDDDVFKAGQLTEIFRQFNMLAKAGLSFQLISQLTFKLGFAWRKEFALELNIKQGSNQVVNTDNNIGLSVEYELTSYELFKIRESPVTFESKAQYLFTVFIASDKPNFFAHDLAWENKISFNIVGGLKLSLGLKFYLFYGTFNPDPTKPGGQLAQGPIALRFDPNVSLGFTWGTRSQF